MEEKKLDLTQETPDCQELDDDALERTSGGTGSYTICPFYHKKTSNVNVCTKCGKAIVLLF